MKEKAIKVGFCVAYDWASLKISLPRVYPYADIVCLSIDKNRRTWRGEKYEFDEKSFCDFLLAIDTQKKIDLYEDDFSIPDLTAMENDTRQRQLLAARMGNGGWHIQIDCDEYFLNFKRCVEFLRKRNHLPTGKEKPINVCVFCIPLVKRISEGYLFVDFKESVPESFPFATTKPEYVRARNSGHFSIFINEYAIHETWARSDEDLWLKMNNWGHSSDELDTDKKRLSFYSLWKILDEYNFMYLSDFHPAIPKTWPALRFIKAWTIFDLLEKFNAPKLPLTSLQLWLRNNRQVARIKFYSKRIFALIGVK
jgi:hypothetical protein